jgi:hypothetical protein
MAKYRLCQNHKMIYSSGGQLNHPGMKLKQTLITLLLLLTSLGLHAQQLHSYEHYDDAVECFICAHAQQNQSALADSFYHTNTGCSHWLAIVDWHTDLISSTPTLPYQVRAPPFVV